jgi:aldose 1-epimerase
MHFRKISIGLTMMLFSFSSAGLGAVQYSVTKKVVQGHTTYHLMDSEREMNFGVVPDIGNMGYEFKVKGQDVLVPLESFQAYLEKRGFCCGIPFLSPWANRLDHDYYFFQGKQYFLNDTLKNFRRDQFKQPIHGLLDFDSRWEVVKSGASKSGGAFITSRLEFYKYPDLMAQFPFAYTVEITYRLKDGKLENVTTVQNVSNADMPVMMAYHPYFHPGGEREKWEVSIGAQKYWIPSPQLISTGETEPIEKFLPGAADLILDHHVLDSVLSTFDRSVDGLGHMWVKSESRKIEVLYSKEFDFAVAYAPQTQATPFICFEPQTGPTNSFNLNHEGKFPELVALGPGKTYTAKFWIVPTGY